MIAQKSFLLYISNEAGILVRLATMAVVANLLGMRSVVGVAIGAYREKDIVPMLKKLIECDEIRMETSSRRKDFMRRHLYKADGRASRGLAELLARAMWGGASAIIPDYALHGKGRGL